jgi:hypothetical protein
VEPDPTVLARLYEGPEWDCLISRRRRRFDDLRIEDRWPVDSDIVLRALVPLLSGLTLRAGNEVEFLGAFFLGSSHPAFFSDDTEDLAATLRDHP